MPDYRRYRVSGGTYFFTINLLERRSDLLIRHIEALREAVRRTRAERSFHIDGWVVLPDHLHCMLTRHPVTITFPIASKPSRSGSCGRWNRTSGAHRCV
jgi:REP element-mobilizing transposase RayT